MKWAEDSHLATQMLGDLAEEIRLEKKHPHVTELIYCLTRSWYNRFRPLPPTPKETMLFVVGVGLEQVLLKAHRQQLSCCKKHGEDIVTWGRQNGGVGKLPEGPCPGIDGIHYAMDFLDYFDQAGEMKSTRIALDKFLERMPVTWERQVLSYLHCEGKTKSTLAVVHLMGSYKPPFPDFMCWHGEATPREIAGHWDWMIGRRDILQHYVDLGEPPPQFTYNEDWECGYCAYKMLCDAMKIAQEARA